MTNEAGRIRVVTGIETIAWAGALALWFAVNWYVGTAWWYVWTDLEHFVAQNLGWGNPLFQGYPFHLRRPG